MKIPNSEKKHEYVSLIYNTYCWFIDEAWGMNCTFTANIEIASDIVLQVKDDMRFRENSSLTLKNRNVAGHILINGSYQDRKTGKFICINF